jgi:hypothetical protein
MGSLKYDFIQTSNKRMTFKDQGLYLQVLIVQNSYQILRKTDCELFPSFNRWKNFFFHALYAMN